MRVAYITVCRPDEEQSGLVAFTMRVKSVSGNIRLKNVQLPLKVMRYATTKRARTDRGMLGWVLYLFRLQP